jgi:hypothetical protein
VGPGTSPAADSSRRPAAAAELAGAERARLELALGTLASNIRELRIEGERFFNHAIHTAPEDLRQRIHSQLRQLREANLGPADTFRLGSLEAQFNSCLEHFNRRLRDREASGSLRLPPPEPARRPRYDPAAGVAIDERPDPAAVEALYAGLYGEGRAAAADLEQFRAYLATQLDTIRRKTGCAQVQFRVAKEEGKLKLKAKPLASSF